MMQLIQSRGHNWILDFPVKENIRVCTDCGARSDVGSFLACKPKMESASPGAGFSGILFEFEKGQLPKAVGYVSYVHGLGRVEERF